MAEDEASERQDRVEKSLARLLGVVAGAATGTATGDPFAASAVAAASVPWIEQWVQRAGREWTRDTRRRWALMLAEGAESVGLDVEEFAEQAGRDEQTRLLTSVTLEAAAHTAHRAKVNALGRALAAGVTADDSTKIDDQHLVIAALADLEVPHIIVLELMTRYRPPWHNEDAPVTRDDEGDRPPEWRVHQIVTARPAVEGAVPVLLAVLERHALIQRHDAVAQLALERIERLERMEGGFHISSRPENSWSASGFGDRIMSLLNEAGDG